MPLRIPQTSDSLSITQVLRFKRIWVLSKHITQQKHAATSMENNTLRPSCSLCYGGHNVTHQRTLTLLSSSVLCQLPLGFYNLYDGEQNQHHWKPSAQHTSSSTSTKLPAVTITTVVKGDVTVKTGFALLFPCFFNPVHIFNIHHLLKLCCKNLSFKNRHGVDAKTISLLAYDQSCLHINAFDALMSAENFSLPIIAEVFCIYKS